MTTTTKLDEERMVATLRSLCASIRARVEASDSLEAIETATRDELDALGREVMTYAVQRGDIDAPEVLINGTRHSKVRSYEDEVHTTFGPVGVTKTSYRKDMRERPVAVMDKRLGLVEGKYTPKCAKILCLLTALAVREDVAAILGEFGGMKLGSATMYRVPQFVAARYEVERVEIEREVRERAAIPATAAIVQFGLDGVMVPQEGEHCDPRGRTPRGDPEPPRHERRVGTLPASPRDCDGTMGVAWHEAAVATAAFYDAEGRHLATTYLGRMPEEHKATLGEMLIAEATTIADERPDLRVALASDGAEGQWEILGRLYQALPKTMQTHAFWLQDFFHVAEHLQDAADAIYGTDTSEARVARAEWAEILRAYDDGVDRVRRALLRHRRRLTSQPKRKKVRKVLTYLRRGKHRMAYRLAEQQNVPMATGPTEAAAKSLVGVRMKRSGARYSQHGGQTILTFLAAHKSQRFHLLWGALAKRYAANVQTMNVAA
jgi:hypothetical protein